MSLTFNNVSFKTQSTQLKPKSKISSNSPSFGSISQLEKDATFELANYAKKIIKNLDEMGLNKTEQKLGIPSGPLNREELIEIIQNAKNRIDYDINSKNLNINLYGSTKAPTIEQGAVKIDKPVAKVVSTKNLLTDLTAEFRDIASKMDDGVNSTKKALSNITPPNIHDSAADDVTSNLLKLHIFG